MPTPTGSPASPDLTGFTTRLEGHAYALGFDLVGIAALGVPDTLAHFDAWLAAGHAASMQWMHDSRDLREDARRPHPGATHAVVVAMNYGGTAPSGPVARYARGDDYHDVLRERLRALHAWMEQELGCAINARPYVDSGPLLERDLAQRAGLGWFGKNTCVINPRLGSFFLLGALAVELPLPVSEPFASDHCGSCTRCLDACPTQAFPAPHVLDANRCISYLTIEHRGDIDPALAAQMGEWIFGCDVCQEVCPWNIKFSRDAREPAFAPRAILDGTDARALAENLLAMDAESYAEALRRSPLKRAKLAGLQRNARIVLEHRPAR